MSLVFEHRWEHALVASVIDAAKKECPNCYLGRTAIQKLVYFLHVLEVPMSFKFRIHHFGPFCDELADTLDWLQADGVIEDQSSQSRYSNFASSENWTELEEGHLDQLSAHQETIESVVNALGSMDSNTLELIATLDYSFRWVHACGGNGPWKQSAIEKFKAIKGNKFKDEEITEWYDRLVNAQLIKK
ncbi:MAG: hypothetical protein COA78_05795 [Blastopirellula sp.]|nr:MAG: hypothetical protein COA78_05795 [Blastopirellula sp.]